LHELLEGEGRWCSGALLIGQKDFNGLIEQFRLPCGLDGLQHYSCTLKAWHFPRKSPRKLAAENGSEQETAKEALFPGKVPGSWLGTEKTFVLCSPKCDMLEV
jgi:hypothetical protein